MNVALIPNLTRANALDVTYKVYLKLLSLGCACSIPDNIENIGTLDFIKPVCENDALQSCDIIISVGGDGSIIHCAKKGYYYKKPVLGINAGRLGFLCGLENNEMSLLEKLCEGDYRTDRRLVLSVKSKTQEGEEYSDICINDCFVSGKVRQRLSSVNIALNGKEFNSFLGDGVIIATPTGSTAYSLSAGGPIVEPAVESIILTPSNPHSLFNRPIIFSSDSVLTAYSAEGEKLTFSTDGTAPRIIPEGEKITIAKAPYYAELIRIKSDNFIDTFYKKLKED